MLGRSVRSRALLKAAVGLTAICLPLAQARADDFWCTTKVVVIGQDTGGGVWMQLDSSHADRTLHLCNLAAEKEVCQGYMALALTAKASGRRVVMRVVGDAGASSCATIPGAWTTALRPHYLAMVD